MIFIEKIRLFLADKRILNAPAKAMIRRGLFHSTKALSKNGAFLFEIETPNDKLDLIEENEAFATKEIAVKKEIPATGSEPTTSQPTFDRHNTTARNTYR